jgi:flagellar hook-associated protein FlgK
MTNQISEQRDAISAVSLDEEMIDMMKFQHAYTVAAKLLTVVDEMMAALIATR